MFKKNEQYNNEEAKLLAAKLRKQTMLTLLTFIVSLSMLVVSSAAWFANNRNVGSDGMKTVVEASPNLIIGKTTDEISGTIVDLQSKLKVSFDAPLQTLRPATHKVGEPASVTGLEYNSNPTAVSFSTGLAKGDVALAFADVPETGAGIYYYDYTVYIASAGKELDADKLTAKMYYQTNPESEGSAVVPDHYNAASIDYYLNGTYVVTDNLVGMNTAAGEAAATAVTLTSGGIKIPFNNATSGAKYWEVTMRFYFDGALEKTAGQTYVYSDSLSPAELGFRVEFNAVEATN